MKIRTFFKTLFCAGLVLSLALYLLYLHGNHIEKTQKPIVDYQYNGYEEKLNYKRSNTILITYKSKQYRLHTGDRNLNKIKSGIFPKLYYASETDYLFFEGDYLPVCTLSAARRSTNPWCGVLCKPYWYIIRRINCYICAYIL